MQQLGPNLLLVNEIFLSLQGEGSRSGWPAIFIRLQGCRVNCPFCDTKYAQKIRSAYRLPDHSQKIVQKTIPDPHYSAYTAAELCALLKTLPSRAQLVVITGGEPCEQNIMQLTRMLAKNYAVQLETSGTAPILVDNAVWVTLSPKQKPIQLQNWHRANEIKIPVQTEADLNLHREMLSRLKSKKIWLQPIDCDQKATKLCVRLCQENNYYLSLQLHKYLNIP
ncbi:MAG: 7-carboxy-7-deazaguanine synthase QueE [Desulfovibrio sp.]|nr:7-carboxy-7-deazaguanine synthase QueE [Desulfovibrio sp.]